MAEDLINTNAERKEVVADLCDILAAYDAVLFDFNGLGPRSAEELEYWIRGQQAAYEDIIVSEGIDVDNPDDGAQRELVYRKQLVDHMRGEFAGKDSDAMRTATSLLAMTITDRLAKLTEIDVGF